MMSPKFESVCLLVGETFLDLPTVNLFIAIAIYVEVLGVAEADVPLLLDLIE